MDVGGPGHHCISKSDFKVMGMFKLNRVRGEYGFTIVELVIVITILLVLAGVSVPAVQKAYADYLIKSQARILVSDLRKIRQLAIGQQVNFRIVFNPAANEYFIQKNENWIDPDTGATYAWKQVGDTIRFKGSLKIESITFTDNKVTFTPTGMVEAGGQVILEDYQGRRIRITVQPGTGGITETEL
jgi:prepilin-type N-terminal cleavage/methylation domain-containing protein